MKIPVAVRKKRPNWSRDRTSTENADKHPCDRCPALLSVLQAAWGGSVLFSKKHKHLIAGIERYLRITPSHVILISADVTCTVAISPSVPRDPNKDMREQIEILGNIYTFSMYYGLTLRNKTC